jgi:hypothetical protein
MRFIALLLLALLTTECSGQEQVSKRTFPEITLTNRIDFTDPEFNQ